MITYRPERDGDESAIHAVHATCFPTADEASLVDALRAAGRLSISLVACSDDLIVGHVAFSPVSLDGAQAGLGLAPVAVLEAHCRQGIADRLIREGLSLCQQAGAGFVVVLGDPAYYGRFGFEPASTFNLQDEYAGGDAFQVLTLHAQALPESGGLVRYAQEFAGF